MLELLPLIGGGIFGAVVKLISLGMQGKAEERRAMFQALNKQQENYTATNAVVSENKGFAFTRRIIALAVTLIIVLLAIYPFTSQINVMQEVQTGGRYLFGLIDTSKIKQEWVQLEGSVVLPVIIPSFQAIIGAYFGASIAGGK